MHKSIRTRMTVILIGILASVILCTWVLNTRFAPSFYLSTEKRGLINNYKDVKKILSGDGSVQEKSRELKNLDLKSNVRFMYINATGKILTNQDIISNMVDGSPPYQQTLTALYSLYLYKINLGNGWNNKAGLNNKYFSLFDFSDISSKGYAIATIKGEDRVGQEMMLIGITDNGYLISLNTSLRDIRLGAAVNSLFLGYMGIIGIILGSIIIFFYSRSFTRPIKEMAHAANRMSGLDFDVRVQEDAEDELGELATSMNRMSTKLEETIADLKTANLELQKDIQIKEEVDEMRKEFLSHVSHELKTPIALIQGYAEGLMEGIIDDEESKQFYCEVIMDEAEKMNQMVKKLLTLNQIEFGNNQIKILRFDIASMIANKLNASSILLKSKNVSIEFPQKEQRWNVWGDEFMMEEVVSNYISNACNHVIDDGKIKVWLDLEGDNVRVHVYNDGRQIPQESIDKIWTKFYKVDKARTREYGGNGIGLSIVEATMKAHGKGYGVRNHEKGVEFWFELELSDIEK